MAVTTPVIRGKTEKLMVACFIHRIIDIDVWHKRQKPDEWAEVGGKWGNNKWLQSALHEEEASAIAWDMCSSLPNPGQLTFPAAKSLPLRHTLESFPTTLASQSSYDTNVVTSQLRLHSSRPLVGVPFPNWSAGSELRPAPYHTPTVPSNELCTLWMLKCYLVKMYVCSFLLKICLKKHHGDCF